MSKQKTGQVLKTVGRIALFSAVATLLVGGIFRLLQDAGLNISDQFVAMAIPIALVLQMSAAKRAGRPSRMLGS